MLVKISGPQVTHIVFNLATKSRISQTPPSDLFIRMTHRNQKNAMPTNRLYYKGHDGVQDILVQNTPCWCPEYLKPKECGKAETGKSLCPATLHCFSSLKAEEITCERNPSSIKRKGDILIIRDWEFWGK